MILRQVEIVVFYIINLIARTLKKMKSSEASRSLPGHASIILASAPALLHEVQLAQASIHVTCVCTYIDTMYISNLYMYQKSFEVPTMKLAPA